MTASLVIPRPRNMALKVTMTEDRIDLATTGGSNVAQAEYDQIAPFVAEHPVAGTFLAKLRTRMER